MPAPRRSAAKPRKQALPARARRVPVRLLGRMTNAAWAIRSGRLEEMVAIANREGIGAVARDLLREDPEVCTMTVRDGVAIIPVIGPTFRYASWMHDVCGATSYDAIARDFNAALQDQAVTAILFEINSPGGEVTGCDQTARMIREARGQKPIVAYVEGDGCSAAYWLASACDHVAIDTTGEVGSIGVVGVYTDTSGADEKAGIKRYELVSSVSPGKRPDPSTDDGRTQLMGTINDLADVFVDAVAANRGRSRDEVLSDFGQGGCFVGAKAVAAGLADEVSSFEEVFAALAGREMRDANGSGTPGQQQTIPGARRATAKGRTMPTTILAKKLKAAGKSGSRPSPRTARRSAGKGPKGPAAEAVEDEDEEGSEDEEHDEGAEGEDEDEGAEGDEDEDPDAEEGDEDEEAEGDDEDGDEDEDEEETPPKTKKASGERGRIQAIVTSASGKAQPELAAFFAFSTGLSPKVALAGLKAAAADGSGSAPGAARGGKRGQAFRDAVAGKGPKVLGRQHGRQQEADAGHDVSDLAAGEDLGRAAARFAQKAGEIPAGKKAPR